MVFSENRTNRVVSAQQQSMRNSSVNVQTNIQPTTLLQYGMFVRLQNVTKCTSCGK